MRISDYLLARLADEGIDTAFCYYGGAISELMDAFTRTDRIKYVIPMTEHAAAFAAEGYSKAKGIPGLAIATSGPGGQNMVTGIANCWFDSTPCIFITGQVQTKFINHDARRRQLGFQEWNPVQAVQGITKYAATVFLAAHFPAMLDAALIQCKSGRRGPVLIDLPIDIQKAEI